jgi:hypothetical protein
VSFDTTVEDLAEVTIRTFSATVDAKTSLGITEGIEVLHKKVSS